MFCRYTLMVRPAAAQNPRLGKHERPGADRGQYSSCRVKLGRSTLRPPKGNDGHPPHITRRHALQAAGGLTLATAAGSYVAGDTVRNDDVANAIKTHKPDAIVLDTGNAYVFVFGSGSLIMGVEEALAIHKAAPEAILIASHMEAVNHCVLSRGALQAYADEQGFLQRLRTPADDETLTI